MIVTMEPAEGRGTGQLRDQVALLPAASIAGKARRAAPQTRGWKQTAPQDTRSYSALQAFVCCYSIKLAPGSSMNWSSWLAKVPAMKEPRNTVMTCNRVGLACYQSAAVSWP